MNISSTIRISLLFFFSIVPMVCCRCHVVQGDSSVVVAEQKPVNGDARFDEYVGYLASRRVALVANHTSMVDGKHLCDTLLAMGVNVVKVFAPEHGFRGIADAGEKVSDGIDAKTGLPVVSLYGKNKKPTARQMSDVDVVLYDLQDVGARFYTYISTMHYMMEACAENSILFIVLDRPNPNGDYIDGPVLEKSCRSFVGLHPIPIIYGLTAGELACMINGEQWLANGVRCDLKVVPMAGYSHGRSLPLDVPPSPNLKDHRAIRLYPSLCLFEGTNVSVGRGTSSPFKIIGAPDERLGNFTFTPVPGEGAKNPLHNGRVCHGLDLSNEPDSVGFRLDYVLDFWRTMGDSAFWLNGRFFDLLAGTPLLRQQIRAGLDADSIRKTWQPALDDYKKLRQKYLIYDAEKTPAAPASAIDWQKAMSSAWVDSVYAALDTNERIAQLVWVTMNIGHSEHEARNICRDIEQYGIGGILFLQNTPYDASRFIDSVSAKSKVPILFAADAENGLAMKFSGVTQFPKNMTLGAIADPWLISQMGVHVARQMRACGLTVNFAPVVDVNTNPRNPVIGIRSFGEDAVEVSRRATAMVAGLQTGGCVAVVKHFPGHGDTSVDSHVGLPVVKNSRERVKSVDLLPFERAIRSGVMGVMSAHLSVPALDSTGKAASLSRRMLTDMLRNEMKFNGLIITDAINMAGIQIAAGGRNAEAEAIAAGNDVVEFSLDARKAISAIRQKIDNGELSMAQVESSVRRVLAVKEWCGLPQGGRPTSMPTFCTTSIAADTLSDRLFDSSLTLLADGADVATARFDQFLFLEKWCRGSDALQAKQPLADSTCIWIFATDKTIPQCNELLNRYAPTNKIVVAYAGNPYMLKRLALPRKNVSLVCAYENSDGARRALLRFATSGGSTAGRLPVTAAGFKVGEGTTVTRIVR